jgi:heme peroxidase
VPRYNEFRRKFHLAPAERFEDFSADPAVVTKLRSIYDDPEDVDLMIGLYAEAPPQGFAFSDTAFRVFILMASRRLKSDRFYTYDFRPEVYSQEGMQWIADNTMGTVLARNFPELASHLEGVKNAFAPWRTVGQG